MFSAEELIERLDLKPLPEEGGFYRETYRSEEKIEGGALPERYRGRSKNFSTAIYYLLTPDIVSAPHRLPSDEIFHFYLGDPVEMLRLYPDGSSGIITLGPRLDLGQELQVVVPMGAWFGACLAPRGRVALMGTTVAPGFDFADYETCEREWLVEKYPARKEMIERLTG